MNSNAIDYFSLGHPLRGIASCISFHMRKKMFSLFVKIMHPTSLSRILDVGVTPDQTLPESNFFEKFYPHKDRLVATSIEDASFLEKEYLGMKFVRTGKQSLPFGEKSFDIVFCSAVLEHVGDRESQKRFIEELLRISLRFFIVTPNRQFPVEFHTFWPFIHWLPQSVHQILLRRLGMEFWSHTENLSLLTPRSFLSLFPVDLPVRLLRQHLLLLPSNIVAYGDSSSE